MLIWIRLIYKRGVIRVLKYLNRFYDALLASWHKDLFLAIFALAMIGVILILFVSALWIFANSVAYFLHGNTAEAAIYGIVSLLFLAIVRLGINVVYWLLPLNETESDGGHG